MKIIITFLPPIIWIAVCYYSFAFPSCTKPIVTVHDVSPHEDFEPWDIVCSKDGRWNFMSSSDGSNSYVYPLRDFATEEEAKAMRDQIRRVTESNRRGISTRTPEAQALIDEVAAKEWKKCK